MALQSHVEDSLVRTRLQSIRVLLESMGDSDGKERLTTGTVTADDGGDAEVSARLK